MVFLLDLLASNPNYELRGKPKGMRRVFDERRLLETQAAAGWSKCAGEDHLECSEARNLKNMPHEKCLSEQADFEPRNHSFRLSFRRPDTSVYFLPTFHCELNHIEMYWG